VVAVDVIMSEARSATAKKAAAPGWGGDGEKK
jgi:hypothetical protein